MPGFPRFYAAASLKPLLLQPLLEVRARFSAVLCRGLIEAQPDTGRSVWEYIVFRGFMPRPH